MIDQPTRSTVQTRLIPMFTFIVPTAVATLKRHPVRVLGRLSALSALVMLAWIDSWLRPQRSSRFRAAWSARWLARCLRIAGVRYTTIGPKPRGGILIANHSSYLAIAVLAAAHPSIFVARHDLAEVTLFGRLARHGGTVFINRKRKRDLLAVIGAFPSIIEDGATPAFFPEATCGDGKALLHFRSSLFAPAVGEQWPVTPVHLRYALDPNEGSASDEICWWGGMAFIPHVLNLLSKRRIEVQLAFGPSEVPGPDRKVLARRLRARVEELGHINASRPPPYHNVSVHRRHPFERRVPLFHHRGTQ
jgi:1-acyl-sn-glycerol-3-phosphate acyltransferase